MLHGHGDDIYSYPDIRHNFSSNIYPGARNSALKEHLCRNISLIDHYPEPTPRSVERLIASCHGIADDCVLVTNGATDAIYLIAQALAHEGYTHYTVRQPTFTEYEDACTMHGMRPLTVTPTEEQRVVSWLCNPNNPTGEVYPLTSLLPPPSSLLLPPSSFLPPPHLLTVIDQSYEAYTLHELLTPAEAVRLGNVFQIHSLTKTYAIPGLRIGYVVAAPALIALLRTVVRPWAVNALAIEAAKFLLEKKPLSLWSDMGRLLEEAQRLRSLLTEIPGVSVLPTSTNFMLATIDCCTAAELKAHLATEHHILIRDASNFKDLTPHHFRIAAQTPEENDLLVEAIARYVG